jgi:aspartyl-tRNA(Asn)/glutamyl-tRNA(Gln) amidotransferase subunit A
VLSSGYYDAYYLQGAAGAPLIATTSRVRSRGRRDRRADHARPPPSSSARRLADPLTMYLADIYTIAVNLAGLPALSVPAASSTACRSACN